jgi:hypothetical protein
MFPSRCPQRVLPKLLKAKLLNMAIWVLETRPHTDSPRAIHSILRLAIHKGTVCRWRVLPCGHVPQSE